MSHRQTCILILVGLPGSGKTSLARELIEFLSARHCVVNCVSFDELVPLEEQARIAQSSSSESTKNYRFLMKDKVADILTSLNDSSLTHVVIVDDNNYYRSMRYEYYQLAARHRIGYLQLYLKCPLEEAVINNERRIESMRVPNQVIHVMHLKIEVPRESWESCIVLETSASNCSEAFESIWHNVEKAIRNPVTYLQALEDRKAEAELSRQCNDRSLFHLIDTSLRKKIGLLVAAQTEAESKKILARTLNEVRLSVLEDAKSGRLLIPEEMVTDRISLEEWGISVFLSRISNS